MVFRKKEGLENFESHFNTDKLNKNITLYRAYLFIGALSYISWSPFTTYVLELWPEPFWWRLVGASAWLLTFFLSFKSEYVKKNIDHLAAFSSIVASNHFIWFVVSKNQWDGLEILLIGLFLMIFCSGVFINRHYQLILYNVITSISVYFSYNLYALEYSQSALSHTLFSIGTFFLLLHIILICKRVLLKNVSDSYDIIKTFLSKGMGPILILKDEKVIYENATFIQSFSSRMVRKENDIVINSNPSGRVNGKQVKIIKQEITINGDKCYVLNIQDISEQIKNNLKQMELSKLASIGELSAGIAHEINNPLLQIQMLVYQAQTTEDRKEKEASLSEISETVDRIAGVIRSLREYSESSSKTRKKVSLNSVIDKVVFMTKQKVQVNKVDLKVSVPDEELVSKIQENKIGLVLINIINNSCYAVKNKEDKKVSLSLARAGDFAEITIQDTGDGIPEEIAQRIFDPFFTTKKVGQGSGLGLSESIAIVKDHGGVLSLEQNQPPIFKIKLPLKEES